MATYLSPLSLIVYISIIPSIIRNTYSIGPSICVGDYPFLNLISRPDTSGSASNAFDTLLPIIQYINV